MVSVTEKPAFCLDQIVSSTEAAKRFGRLRQKAKLFPMVIVDKNKLDTVVMSYDQYEKMYKRLAELEAQEEARLLGERMADIERDPDANSISWRTIKRTQL